jgi:hypothetical protein
MTKLLGSRFVLHDIDDIERFTASIIHRGQFKLNASEREELHTFLIETAWELSRDFCPGRLSFSSFAGSTLRLRVVDWHRQRFGRRRWQWKDRTYERPKIDLVSLDADRSARDRLDASLIPQASDLETDCGPDLGRVLAGGNSQRARDLRALDLEPYE